VDPASGDVLARKALPPEMFGEGLTVWGDRLVQLTWRSGVGLVWSLDNFESIGTFRYPGQGWGLTHDGHHLVMSDGTPTLRFLDPATFREVARLQVQEGGKPLSQLNELEYVQGEIYANVLNSSRVARIDPETGGVLGWIELAGLLTLGETARADVLNGIAYDAENDRLFVTGKLWPKLFEIKLQPGNNQSGR